MRKNITIPHYINAELKQIAKQEDTTESGVITIALERFFAELRTKDQGKKRQAVAVKQAEKAVIYE